jgi:hypothetical protein
MSTNKQFRVPHLALFAIALGPAIGFLAAIPWLKQQPDAVVFLAAGVVTVLAVVAGFSHSVLSDRAQDEWHRSGSRFASQWGWLTGLCIVALLIALPPVHDLLFAVVSWAAVNLANAPAPDREVVLLTFTFAFVIVSIIQTISTMLLAIGWFSWMSRSARGSDAE